MKPLSITPRRMRFAEAYVEGYSATEAAILAGYSATSAASNAHRLLKDESVCQAIGLKLKERTDQQGKAAERLILGLSDILLDENASRAEVLRACYLTLQTIKHMDRRRPRLPKASKEKGFELPQEEGFDHDCAAEQKQLEERLAALQALAGQKMPQAPLELPPPPEDPSLAPSLQQPAPAKPRFAKSLKAALNLKTLQSQQQKRRAKTQQNTFKNHHSAAPMPA